ncbi:adenylosuccinate synthetase [Aequorivita sp. Q41]|uniref:adenylosuccinate synthetase n=1 Tax=Aequorivita sp. Q41 TaxID=3153300 RepID=UPI003242EF9C
MKTKKNILLAFFSILISTLYAQKPTEMPKPTEKPVDLSNPADIIIYIVLPICAVVFYFIWRKKRKK